MSTMSKNIIAVFGPTQVGKTSFLNTLGYPVHNGVTYYQYKAASTYFDTNPDYGFLELHERPLKPYEWLHSLPNYGVIDGVSSIYLLTYVLAQLPIVGLLPPENYEEIVENKVREQFDSAQYSDELDDTYLGTAYHFQYLKAYHNGECTKEKCIKDLVDATTAYTERHVKVWRAQFRWVDTHEELANYIRNTLHV